MALECPHCRHPQPKERQIHKAWIWAQWRCPNCESLLAFDKRRRVLLALAIPVAVVPFNLIATQSALRSPGVFGLALVCLCFLMLLLWWRFERLVVLEPRGTYCGQCGYDLTGNTSGRCPECGTARDPETEAGPSRTRDRAGAPRP